MKILKNMTLYSFEEFGFSSLHYFENEYIIKKNISRNNEIVSVSYHSTENNNLNRFSGPAKIKYDVPEYHALAALINLDRGLDKKFYKSTKECILLFYNNGKNININNVEEFFEQKNIILSEDDDFKIPVEYVVEFKLFCS